RGIGERTDQVEHLDHRAGPAVRDDQRQGVLVFRLDVDEVDVHSVDLGRELGKRVEPLLEPPEVVVLGPVAREFAEERDLDPLRGVLHELGGGPARRLDAATQVSYLLVRDLDAERPDPGCSLGGGAHVYLPCGIAFQRNDLNPARTSSLKSCGCSQAAKWPPLSTSLK